MKRSHKIITVIVLMGVLLASGILPDHGYYAQFRTIELCSEAESVEERAVNPLNTHAVQRVKFRGSLSPEVVDRSFAFHSIFIPEVAKAVLPDIPRFIRFCSLLNQGDPIKVSLGEWPKLTLTGSLKFLVDQYMLKRPNT